MDILKNIYQFLVDSVSLIVNYISQVINFFVSLFAFIPTIISFIPNPFRTITLMFLPVFIAIFCYRLYKN